MSRIGLSDFFEQKNVDLLRFPQFTLLYERRISFNKNYDETTLS